MEFFEPTYYFELSSFEHQSLFDNSQWVWEALTYLKTYLASIQLGNINAEVSQGAYLINPESITIGNGTVVEPGAYIQGPCIIGENCTIRHGAYIRGNLITGSDCVIGHDTEVKNAVFLNGVHAAHFAYVGDSILGNNVNLGAGTICANLKLNRQQISITHEGKLYPTGLRKLGAIMGDNSQTGCNTVTNPGTLMGKGVMSYPCTNFGGFIPQKSLIKNKNNLSIKQYS
jgi:NDP-sugar pyrophosphorylase family protein